MRICGDCSECCRLLSVRLSDNYYSPCGHWCKHCTQPGCGIYNTIKQKKCKEFNCGWLQNENIPENLKPNLSGIVLEVLNNVDHVIANSNFTKNLAIELGVEENKIKVKGNQY